MSQLTEQVEPPKHQCSCGWTSWDAKFDLIYHAFKHECKKAKFLLRKSYEKDS